MAIGDSIQRYPLLRLVVCFVCGIAVADAVYPSLGLSPAGLWVGCLVVLLASTVVYVLRREAWQVGFGLLAMLLFFSVGLLDYTLSRHGISYAWPSEERIYEARVMESPRQRAHSTWCLMQVEDFSDSSAWCGVHRKAYVYMEPTAMADSLLPGDIVWLKGRMRPPQNFSDELSFDYARYVTLQGVSGTMYVPADCLKRVGEAPLSLRERMLRLRHRLYTRYMRATFDEAALGVLAALSLGERRALSAEVRAVYADAGIAHALALSGLHVGVIYGMLAFVMQRMVRRRSLRWLRELLIVSVLWLFALLTGMSASVVRAVVMCTLYVFARWVSRDSSPLQVLSLAAMVMLLVRPFYLFDVGFQLSFASMAAILVVEPYLELLVRLPHARPLPALVAYPVSVVCMSLAAQLGTFPLVLYHFGTFPLYFLITNFIAVPLLAVLLFVIACWWCLVLMGVPAADHLAHLMQWVVLWGTEGLACIARWPYAVLHVGHFPLGAVCFTYLSVGALVLYAVKRCARDLVVALASLLGVVLSFLL